MVATATRLHFISILHWHASLGDTRLDDRAKIWREKSADRLESVIGHCVGIDAAGNTVRWVTQKLNSKNEL